MSQHICPLLSLILPQFTTASLSSLQIFIHNQGLQTLLLDVQTGEFLGGNLMPGLVTENNPVTSTVPAVKTFSYFNL